MSIESKTYLKMRLETIAHQSTIKRLKESRSKLDEIISVGEITCDLVNYEECSEVIKIMVDRIYSDLL